MAYISLQASGFGDFGENYCICLILEFDSSFISLNEIEFEAYIS
jgi:hypothetical protein